MDHLVFASPSLDEGVRHVEDLLGVETSPGGRHLGFGTRNRLLGFGPDGYMEVVSIDPDQPEPARSRWFGIDALAAPRLVTWCARADDLPTVVERSRAAGIDLGELLHGRRQRSDGSFLEWTMTDPWAVRADGVIPFFIDWGTTPHPGTMLPARCAYLGLRIEHPEPRLVAGWLSALGLDVPVRRGDSGRLVASIETPSGIVELS